MTLDRLEDVYTLDMPNDLKTKNTFGLEVT